MQRTPYFFAFAALLAGGCVALGWRFGPGFSVSDPALFAAPPVVEHRDAGYFLCWTQGSLPFFFQPDYKVLDGRLVFALVATSSTGSLAGRKRALKIEGRDAIYALQHGGAFWWEPEPDGRFVRLRIVEQRGHFGGGIDYPPP